MDHKDIFHLLSSNGEFITKTDLGDFYLFFCNSSLPDSKLEKMISEYDTNGDGQLDYNEFLSITLEDSRKNRESFYDFISNKEQNDLNYDEIRRIYTEYPISKNIAIDKQIKILGLIFDDNNDSKVSRSEFLNNLEAILKEKEK